ncbi:hypothetical protein GCM10010260_35920 [Streptomyces filipinensis]|uniref:Uncharacterized protein n=1 Tax=Streptomyces filipinensis TaxID=66887 RepID=A0A918MC54_9ACTN|nr:hypothetical protein GCM10010260_35920 [Streptomyces filipinensis]
MGAACNTKGVAPLAGRTLHTPAEEEATQGDTRALVHGALAEYPRGAVEHGSPVSDAADPPRETPRVTARP